MTERLNSEQIALYMAQIGDVVGSTSEALGRADDEQYLVLEGDLSFLKRLEGAFISAGRTRTAELQWAIGQLSKETEEALRQYQQRRADLEGLLIASGEIKSTTLPSGRPLIFGAQDETPKLTYQVADHQDERTTLADQLRQSEQA